MSGPGQGARRTGGWLRIAGLFVALPASLAAAAVGRSPALLDCVPPSGSPVSAASPALPPAPLFPALPPPPASRLPPESGAAWHAIGALIPDECPQANAEFGFAMALGREPGSGLPLLAIGARLGGQSSSSFGGQSRGGAVYLFEWDPVAQAWEEMPSYASTQPGEQFGFSVALHGDTLAVGAPGEQRDQERPVGTVYLIQLTTTVNLPASVASLERAIVLDDQWLAVSATIRDAGGVLGVVLVYPPPFTSSVPRMLMPAMPQPGDRFGKSLALSHGTLIVGAPSRRGIAGQAAAGAVYLFSLADGGQPVGELRPLREAADAQFGSSVAVSGSSLAVGAIGAGGTGAVYVFTLANGTWTQQAPLAPDLAHAAVGERFGDAVAIDDNLGLVAAGAPLSSAGAAWGGAAFLFQRHGDAWDAVPGSPVAGTEPHALFGSEVALLDGFFLVAAPLANQGAGAVYTYVNFPVEAGAASSRPSGVPAECSSGGGDARRPAPVASHNAGAAPP
jgi:hypothetical protein